MNTLNIRREITLDYVKQGRGLGVPVVFLHGFTDSRRSFDRVLARMPASVCSIAVSQRGHGESDRPEEDYSPSAFAADVADLLDRLKLQQAVIVGHCMGALVAERFALDYPERTRGLILTGAMYSLKEHAGISDFWQSTVCNLEDPVDPSVAREFQSSTIANPLPDSFFETIVQESLKVPARVWKATLRALMQTDFTGELRNIRVPTMLLWGDRDVFASRADQDRLLAAIPGSRLQVYAGIGHSPHWEDPARFVADVMDFVPN